MHALYTQLKNIFVYAGLETCIYQTLLVIHQIMLYHYVDISFYGMISAVFSTVYLATLHINLGLDLSFAPLFSIYKNSSAYFKKIADQIIANMLFGFCASMLMCYIISPSINLTQSQFFICCTLAISETTKKSLKSILHLLLAHRYIMAVEIGALCLYIFNVWALLYKYSEPSITIIFLPLLITSCLSVLIYSYMYAKYIGLIPTCTYAPSTAHLLLLRIQHYIYQVIQGLYSPNFLVSLVAFNDIKLAATLKIISIGLYGINNVIRYMFGVTSSVLFSHSKKTNIQEKANIFPLLHQYLYKTLTSIGILFVAYHYIFFNHLSYHHATIIYLFLLLILSEDLTIAYEHFFIAEEQTLFLIICYATIMIPVVLLKGLQYKHVEHILPVLITMRSIYMVMIYCYKQYYFACANKKSCYTSLDL